MVEFTTAYDDFLITSANSLDNKNPSNIYLKIRVRDEWLGSGRHNKLKCLVNRGVS